MEKFKFKYASVVWVLLVIVLILSLGGLAWNIFNLTQYIFAGAFKITVYAVIILLTTFLIVFVISIMLFGRYVVKDGFLITQFGFIFEKTAINDIVGITHFKKSNKLVMYFKDEKYTVIVISVDEYERFIKSIRAVNQKIVYDARIDGEDTPV